MAKRATGEPAVAKQAAFYAPAAQAQRGLDSGHNVLPSCRDTSTGAREALGQLQGVPVTHPTVSLEPMRRAPDQRALFVLLGVNEKAPWEDVRRAFRAAVRASHPDLHAGDPAAERRLKTLNAAWESVNTPSKWAAYILPPTSRRTTGRTARTRRGAAVPSVGRVHVRRQQRGSFGMANWNLELDGEVIASIENGGIRVLEARPGRHSVRVFYASHSSLPLQVELHPGQEVTLGCRQLENLRINLFSPRRSLVLEPLDSRRFGQHPGGFGATRHGASRDTRATN